MIYSQSGVLIESSRPKAMSGLGTQDVVRMLKTCEMGSPTLSTTYSVLRHLSIVRIFFYYSE